MAKASGKSSPKNNAGGTKRGNGGETHQTARGARATIAASNVA